MCSAIFLRMMMTKIVTRSKRKLDHLEEVLKRPLNNADFSGVKFVHNSLPEIDLKMVDLKTNLAGIDLAAPFFINAITGGAAETLTVNKKLAQLSKELKLPLAVGSQAAALEDPRLSRTYTIVREIYPEGIIFANIGPAAGLKEAKAAVKMLAANALQIHLNAPQEMLMEEGERDFRGWRRNIHEICSGLEVPVIVKETGFGISFEAGKIIKDLGAAAIDISGSGGTNFIEIELARQGKEADSFSDWGIPTAVSLIEVLAKIGSEIDIIASGGINTVSSAVKALALGAKAVAFATLPLKLIIEKGLPETINYFTGLVEDTKKCMALLGACDLQELQKVPLVLTGETREWLASRSLNLESITNRKGA